MPEKVEEPNAEVQEVKQQDEQVESTPAAEAEPQETAAEAAAEVEEENGAQEKNEETAPAEAAEEPKPRGRKPKVSEEGPASKKAKVKELKSPGRVSTRVRNRSIGEKLPEFKDMEDELPSPTRRRAKIDDKPEEKAAEDSEPQPAEATA